MSYQNKDRESIGLYAQAFDRSKTCNGGDDPQTLRFLASVANAKVKAGQQAEAISMLENVFPIWQKKIPRGSPYMIEILQPLGRAYVETGRFHDAEGTANEKLESLRQANIAPTHKYFGYARLMLGRSAYWSRYGLGYDLRFS